jgi:tetratricopeptide (TPR) repeat protein
LHRIVQPKYSFGIFYNWGSSYRIHYDYPYYRRRYVFVSLGGYWPSDCRYRRYYWYPSHFYNWYGYQPIAREIPTSNNYYTYNYYGDESGTTDGYIYDSGGYATHDTYADVRENMDQQENVEPAAEELSDTYFEAGVKAFEDSDYGKAVERFRESLRLAPDDPILPFAFSQALFADGRYDQAAEVLRAIAKKFEPEKEGLFYPRGLYLDEEVLLKQVDQLASQAELSAFNPDVELLLGYHLLGIGEIDASIDQLAKAANTPVNNEAATALLKMAVQIKTTNDK